MHLETFQPKKRKRNEQKYFIFHILFPPKQTYRRRAISLQPSVCEKSLCNVVFSFVSTFGNTTGWCQELQWTIIIFRCSDESSTNPHLEYRIGLKDPCVQSRILCIIHIRRRIILGTDFVEILVLSKGIPRSFLNVPKTCEIRKKLSNFETVPNNLFAVLLRFRLDFLTTLLLFSSETWVMYSSLP